MIASVIAVAIASRPIVTRLWRAGRLSDRATARLLLARFPIVVGLFGLMLGLPPPLWIGILALVSVTVVPFYTLTLDLLRDQAREFEGEPPSRSRTT